MDVKRSIGDPSMCSPHDKRNHPSNFSALIPYISIGKARGENREITTTRLFNRVVTVIDAGCAFRLAAAAFWIWQGMFLYRGGVWFHPPHPLYRPQLSNRVENELAAVRFLVQDRPPPYSAANEPHPPLSTASPHEGSKVTSPEKTPSPSPVVPFTSLILGR